MEGPGGSCATSAAGVDGCEERDLSGLLSASFMVRCRKNWRGALHRAIWTSFALSLTLVVLYNFSVQTLRLTTSAFPLEPVNAERIELNLRVWHTWSSGLGDYAVFGLGPAAVHIVCFWMTHGLLGLLERTRPKWAEPYRLSARAVSKHHSSSGDDVSESRAIRRVTGNQVLAIVFGLLISPALQYRVGSWNTMPMPSFGQVQSSILLFALAAETTTYYLHRLLHTPWFWRNVHAKHHSYCSGRSFNGVAALDMHFAEFLALKLVPIASGPLLLPSVPNCFCVDLLSIYLWVGLSTIACAAAHSTFNFPALPNPVHRFYHLAYPGSCFGIFGVFDLLHSTDAALHRTVHHSPSNQQKEEHMCNQDPQVCLANPATSKRVPKDTPLLPKNTLRGKVSGLELPRGQPIASKYEILIFSLVHQATLLLVGVLGNICPYVHTRLWLPASSYTLVGLGMWLTHWLGHRKIIPAWFEFHVMGHHVRSYPSSRFLTERYVSYTCARKGDRGELNTLLDMNAIMYLPWPFVVAFVHHSLLSATASEVGLCFGVSTFLLCENEYMHQQVHLLNSRWSGYRWFEVMRKLHFLHHKEGMQHNYAMADFFFDFISGNLMNLY